MGVLVTGAMKVEEELDSLKRNVQLMTEQRSARAYSKLRPVWNHVKNSLESPPVKPIVRRIEPMPNQFKHETKVLLGKAELRAGETLAELVDRTIVELEKVKRRLDQRFPKRWHGAA